MSFGVGGSRFSALSSEGRVSRPFSGRRLKNRAPHTSGRHFVTRIEPSRSIPEKKGRKEARVQLLRKRAGASVGSTTTAAAGPLAAHAPSCFGKKPSPSAFPSFACARASAQHALAPAESPPRGAGACARRPRVGTVRVGGGRARLAAGCGRGRGSGGAWETGGCRGAWRALVVCGWDAGARRRSGRVPRRLGELG